MQGRLQPAAGSANEQDAGPLETAAPNGAETIAEASAPDAQAAVRYAVEAAVPAVQLQAERLDAATKEPEVGDIVQLSLFAVHEAKPEKPSKRDAKADKVLEQLRSADLMNMTPMTAMNFLYELKKQLPN